MYAKTFCLISLLWLTTVAGLGPFAAHAATPPPLTQGSDASATRYKVSSQHPRILLVDPILKSRLQNALTAPNPAALKFRHMVNDQLSGQRAYGFQPWFAALMYQLKGDADFAEFAIRETDQFVAQEEARIAGGQAALVAGDSYLEVGDIVGNVAIVYDWCFDRLTPSQRARWLAYANQAVFNVWHPREASWSGKRFPWTGWSIDNPSNNYHYSFLKATMQLGLASLGENPQAQGWLTLFREDKIERQLLPTFNRDLAGGGSREGTGYGTAQKNLFKLYYWWAHSTGEDLARRTPHSLASMAHMLHSMVPTLDRLAPTGDHARDASAALFDYHRESLLVLTALFPDERLSAVALQALRRSSVPEMKSGFMFLSDVIYERPATGPAQLADLSPTYWASGTGQLMMRSSWGKGATFANLICGPYTESHAHRDQGSFVLYANQWLATDANLYSRSGIQQDESNHNLVRFERQGLPVKQTYGSRCDLAALADTPHYTYALARVTPVYSQEPGIKKVEREWVFIKPGTVVIADRVAFAKPVTAAIWTLNLPGPAVLEGDTLTWAGGGDQLTVRRLAPAGLAARSHTMTAQDRDYSAGVRVDVRSEQPDTLFLHVLSVNGAVQSASRLDAVGQTGAQLKLADGREVTLHFSNGAAGATLTLQQRDGSQSVSGPLPQTVVPPPLFAH